MCSVRLKGIGICTSFSFLCVQNPWAPLKLHIICTRSLCTGHHSELFCNRKHSLYPITFTPHYWTSLCSISSPIALSSRKYYSTLFFKINRFSFCIWGIKQYLPLCVWLTFKQCFLFLPFYCKRQNRIFLYGWITHSLCISVCLCLSVCLSVSLSCKHTHTHTQRDTRVSVCVCTCAHTYYIPLSIICQLPLRLILCLDVLTAMNRAIICMRI